MTLANLNVPKLRSSTRANAKAEAAAAEAAGVPAVKQSSMTKIKPSTKEAAVTATADPFEDELELPKSVGNRFIVDKDLHLGSGHAGCVYQGQNISTGQLVAIKLGKTRISSKEIHALKDSMAMALASLSWRGDNTSHHGQAWSITLPVCSILCPFRLVLVLISS